MSITPHVSFRSGFVVRMDYGVLYLLGDGGIGDERVKVQYR